MPNPPSLDPARGHRGRGPLRLPAEGREGEPPTWPLTRRSKAEQVAWAQLWATPQAVAWERLGWTRVVARYCRVMLRAEMLDKDAMAEARQLEDRLGLTPKAMRLLLWEIVADEVGAQRQEPISDARRRIKAV